MSDANSNMIIVEKYEKLINYLYPILQSIPRTHGVAKNLAINDLLIAPSMMMIAGKTGQVSKLYVIDAQLATVRYWMRFLVVRRCLTSHQQQTAQALMSEVGAILGAWIASKKKQG